MSTPSYMDTPSVDRLGAFLSDWRFPVVVLSLLAGFVVLMIAILLIPGSSGSIGAFADTFRTWCFNYDPDTGRIEWAYVWMYVVQPLVLAGGVYLLWRAPVREVIQSAPRRIIPYGAGAAVAVGVLAVALVGLSDWESRPAASNEWPGSRIRTTVPAATFSLLNQNGERITAASMNGRVLLISAVYASCTSSCPLIIGRMKSVLAELPPHQREEVAVVLFTLDPERDTPEALGRLAGIFDVRAPRFNLLTGARAEVEAVLDRYQFSRYRDPDTRRIDHANQFVLVDRFGRVAYRLDMGTPQDAWLVPALRQLIEEDASNA